MCTSLTKNTIGGKLASSKKVQQAVRNAPRNTLGGKMMGIKKPKSSSPKRRPVTPPVQSTRGDTGLRIN